MTQVEVLRTILLNLYEYDKRKPKVKCGGSPCFFEVIWYMGNCTLIVRLIGLRGNF